MIASRAEKRALREAERARRGILYRADFAIRGAFRFEERREACERLRLSETPEGQVVPIVLANIRRGDTDLSAPAGLPRPDAKRSEASRGDTPQTRKGCGAALVVTVLVALALATMGACVVGIDRL